MSQNKTKQKPIQNNVTKKAPPNTTSNPQKEPNTKKYCQYCNSEINSKDSICSRCRYNDYYEEDDLDKNTKKKSISVSHASSSSNNGGAPEKHTKEVSSNHFNSKETYYELSKARIPLKNLVYVIGLAPEISKEEILSSYEYFGQYGKINKLVVNKNMPYNPNNQKGPSFSAYITYSNEREASLAIYAIDEIPYCNRILRASYGTTKYCTYFLKNQECPNAECFYLHSFIKNETSYDKDQISNNKNIFADQQKLALSFLKKCFSDVLKIKPKNVETKLPNISEIINKLKEIKNEEKNIKEESSEEQKVSNPKIKELTSSKSTNDDKSKPKTQKITTPNIDNTNNSSRTNKNKQQPQQPHKEKILDIISLDEPPKLDKPKNNESNSNNNSKKDEEEKMSYNHLSESKQKKNNKTQEKKKKNLENDDKDETNSLPEKSHDYYEFEDNKNDFMENDEKSGDDMPPLEIKATRKTESMYIEVSEVDREIIKLFLSDKFGKNENSRFSFANSKTSIDSKPNQKIEEACKMEIDMRKSMQEFLKLSLSPSFSPEKAPKNIETTGILFEKFINPITYIGENKDYKMEEYELKQNQTDENGSKKNIIENIKTSNNNYNSDNKNKN